MKTIDKLMMMQMAANRIEELKQFYTDKLGFKVTNDMTYNGDEAAKAGVPAGARWIAMELPGGGTSINLTNVFENMQPGTQKLYLSTPDIEATFKELKAKGVHPVDEISRAGWGTSFGFNDPDGNQWRVVEAKW